MLPSLTETAEVFEKTAFFRFTPKVSESGAALTLGSIGALGGAAMGAEAGRRTAHRFTRIGPFTLHSTERLPARGDDAVLGALALGLPMGALGHAAARAQNKMRSEEIRNAALMLGVPSAAVLGAGALAARRHRSKE
jgi:hypothetical protein